MSHNQVVLITGSRGFVGSMFLEKIGLAKKQLPRGYIKNTKIGDLVLPTHKQMDITKKLSVEKYFSKFRPKVIIHFAAYRDAGSAELERFDQKGVVWKTNVEGPKILASLAKKYDAFLIHISTDMVFSGKKDSPGPYAENENTEHNVNFLSWYGWTKKNGEDAVINSGCKYAVVRIGNVSVPILEPKLDYVGKILWLYKKNSLYPLFNDQKITLSSLSSLTKVLVKLARLQITGIYHIATTDLVSPYQLARYLVDKSGGNLRGVMSNSINNYLREFPNRYPKYGGLTTKFTEEGLDIQFETWEEIADNLLKLTRYYE